MELSRKRIAVLGSTGSIGTQTLDIIQRYPERFEATCLVAGTRVDELAEQCHRFRPHRAIIADPALYARLRDAVSPLGIECEAGSEAVAHAMGATDIDMVVTATVGYSGLAPTISAINAGKEIALANKETLVVAGDLVTRLLKTSKSQIIPVDSEHSAIYQCLLGEDPKSVSRLIITASGGPFRTMAKEALERVTPTDALRHPKWEMGAKITIDSATMLNKAFEIIEAHWLFGVSPDRIDAVVHPQSIIHSMVEFADGAVKAQLGLPDMHLPISFALGLRERLQTQGRTLTLADYATLTFEEPDTDKFPCLTLARLSLERGGNTACVVNAANEVANAAFRNGRIGFNDIYRIITDTLGRASFIATPTLDDYVASNSQARAIAEEFVNKTTSK